MALRDGRDETQRTVLLSEFEDAPWTLVRVRLRDRVGARLHGLTLDAQLAAGAPVATDRLRAVRAAMLVAPAMRLRLAEGWQGVLRPSRSIIPVRRPEVLVAHDEILELTAALRCAGPVAPRGVALANLLLTDGTGPLYTPDRGLDLREQIQIAVDHLRPLQASRP